MHSCLHLTGEPVAIGRLDQLLYPFFLADNISEAKAQEIIEEAAKAILSGGAHPILIHDDRLVEGLKNSGSQVTLASARDYACDGCYDPMFAGQTEFAFSNVPMLNAFEHTLNQGTAYASAGPVFLCGQKNSLRTPHPSQITTTNASAVRQPRPTSARSLLHRICLPNLRSAISTKRCLAGTMSGSTSISPTRHQSTYEQAAQNAQRYDLVRVRMGDWSEFFIAMLPEHQKQHERRPYFTAESE